MARLPERVRRGHHAGERNVNKFVQLNNKEVTLSNYWVVGATWGGIEDQSDKFIRRGYWFLGWSDADQPAQAKRRDQMQPGDRIAIKRMCGQASKNIAIRALGIIKEIDKDDHDNHRVYVDWFVRFSKEEEREVLSRGAYGSIHGPYTADDPWVKEVFHI